MASNQALSLSAGVSSNTSKNAPFTSSDPTFRIYRGDPDSANCADTYFWEMDVLPAITPANTFSGEGTRVPNTEVGISSKVRMRVATQPIIGGTPIKQSLGIEGQMMTFVGAFLGRGRDSNNFVDHENADANSYTGTGPNKVASDSYTSMQLQKVTATAVYNKISTSAEAYYTAEQFNSEIVLPGREVTVIITYPMLKDMDLNIASSPGRGIRIKATGYITSIDYMHVRATRTYYRFVLDVTKFYPSKRPLSSGTPELILSPENKQQSCTSLINAQIALVQAQSKLYSLQTQLTTAQSSLANLQTALNNFPTSGQGLPTENLITDPNSTVELLPNAPNFTASTFTDTTPTDSINLQTAKITTASASVDSINKQITTTQTSITTLIKTIIQESKSCSIYARPITSPGELQKPARYTPASNASLVPDIIR